MNHLKTRIGLAVAVSACAFISRATALGGECGPPKLRGGLCPTSTGPDVIVGDLLDIFRLGSSGATTAYAFGTMACNYGNTTIPWQPTTNNHPVITQNMYRLKDGRFEQIGLSWAKHGFTAFQETCCCPTCIDPGNGNELGVGCSDIYTAGLNADQTGFSGMGGLGPRSDINPSTGVYSFPYPTQGQSGNVLYKRLQVANDDFDPSLNPGARFFAEGVYFSSADAAANNDNNNASWREFVVAGPHGSGGFVLSMLNSVHALQPAVYAWQFYDASVQIFPIDVPGDGRMYLACRVYDNGNGTWDYEYALYNYNSHRGAQRFSIPSTSALNVTNPGFHDISHHSGEPYASTDWSMPVGGDVIEWACQTYEQDVNANALRWGTLYNFRFTADAGPVNGDVEIGLFRPGKPNSMTVTVPIPNAPEPVCPADIANDDNKVNVADLFLLLANWNTNGPGADLAPPTTVVNVSDLFVLLGAWGNCD